MTYTWHLSTCSVIPVTWVYVLAWQIPTVTMARWRAILEAEEKCKAKVEQWVEETESGQDCRSPLKQKGQVEGEQVACNCCVMWGFKCQVSQI